MVKYIKKYRKPAAQKRKNELADAKQEPCMDCGGQFSPEAMDFDHVRGKKEFEISSQAGRNKGWKRVLTEIEKCDLVCSNCHRVRTVKRLR